MNKSSIEFSQLNRLLRNKDREVLKPTIDLMFKYCSEMMNRKIPEANVQQAFVLDIVTKISNITDSILSVGCFEDTAYETLKQAGYNIVGIDPEINFSLHDYRMKHKSNFDIIFSTSVLEHVKNDEEFIQDICCLLTKPGVAILTCDFNNDYRLGMPVPNTVIRQYTEYDLRTRLNTVLNRNDCRIIGSQDWSGDRDFLYQGHHYSFATFVFERI